MSALLAAALAYAVAGWPVFPCKPEAKVPATHHGCKDASTNPELIRRWWIRMPAANVAIATGAPGPDVVDVDVKGEHNGMDALNRLRRAGLLAGPVALVRTPSGGVHLYYRGSEQGNGAMPRHGIDFRGRGGYVLAPPSTVDGRPYELVERREDGRGVDWAAIRRFLDPPPPAPVLIRREGTARRGGVANLARWLERQPEGNRNEALYWAACRAVETGHVSEDDGRALVDAAVAAGLSELEARRTLASAYRRIRGKR